jgi:hypothetical protein
MIANVVKDLALDAFNWPGAAAFAAVAPRGHAGLARPHRGRERSPAGVMPLVVGLLVAFIDRNPRSWSSSPR